MLNNKFFYFLLPVCIALGVLIPCEFNVKFQSAEQWVPKKDIERTIQSFQKIRLIQLMNWPSVRQHILKEFPMIQSMGLSFGSFPKIQINIIEKQPWAIIVHQQKHYIVSKDGTLLNQKLRDVELPDFPIMMINASTSIVKNNELEEPYHNVLNELSNALSTVPFFELQQIKLTEKNIRLVEVNGKEVNLGDFSNIGEKMRSFKYFLGSEGARKKTYDFIDIQFNKRVIIK